MASNTKICIFSKHLHWLNWEEMVKATGDIGFDGIDLTIRPNGHVHPEKVEDELPQVVEICGKNNIEITMLSTTIEDASSPVTEKILRTASNLGIKYYRMNWYHYDNQINIERNLINFKSKMKDLEAINKQYNIKGSYQNHDGDWFGSAIWDLAGILKEISSEWLGCQYDILNASLEGFNSWSLGFELIAPFIHTIDIKDGYWNFEKGQQKLSYVPLGKGMVNYSKFFKLINKFNITAPLSLHLEYDLGGAEQGAKDLSVPGSIVIESIKEDLKTLVTYLAQDF